MQIRHVCESCGKLLAVCEHSSYAELRRCWLGMKRLRG
jgi:phage FluMu protein Com